MEVWKLLKVWSMIEEDGMKLMEKKVIMSWLGLLCNGLYEVAWIMNNNVWSMKRYGLYEVIGYENDWRSKQLGCVPS
jgi:hypothetical protein